LIRLRRPGTDVFSRRVDQLEEKLANLASILYNPEQGLKSHGSSVIAPQSTDQLSNLRQHATPTSSTPGQSSSRSPAQDLGVISNAEDSPSPGQLIYFFRYYMSDQFPFVIVPPGTTAEELNRQKPFLYQTVLMVAAFQYKPFQEKAAKEIWEYLGTHMIVKAEKSLDLLQGLLVLMAWLVISIPAHLLMLEMYILTVRRYHSHIHLARRMTLMLQLANSLIIDLGLNPKSAMRSVYNRSEGSHKAYPQDEAPVKQLNLEECRAFLGLKYMTSVLVTIPVVDLSELICPTVFPPTSDTQMT
jgi:hypothetical protein